MSLTDVDNILFDALREWAPLTTLLAAHRIQVPERGTDLRGRKCFDLKGVIRIEPTGWSVNPGGAPDNSMREDHTYEIILETAGLDLATARALEHTVRGALWQLANGKTGAGAAVSYPVPYTAVRWYPMASGSQAAEPADAPNRWVTKMMLKVSVDYPITSIVASAAAPLPLSANFTTATNRAAAVIVSFNSPLAGSVLVHADWTVTYGVTIVAPVSAHVWDGGHVVLACTAIGAGSVSVDYAGTDLIGSNGVSVAAFTALTATEI